MNVLLTCAGRRNYLVDHFRRALAGRGEVFAADARADAPALAEADGAFVVPPVDNAAYIPTLADLCRAHEIRLIIPLNDLELPVLAAARTLFLKEGVFPVVSSEQVVDTCFDKWKAHAFIASCDLPVPPSYLLLEDAVEAARRGELAFPAMVKPRWGTASIALDQADDVRELDLAYRFARRRATRSLIARFGRADPDRSILVQQRLNGEDYGLDVVNDLHGAYVTTFVRRKLGMRAGETERAETVESPEMEEIGRTVGTRLGHVGNLDVDVIVERGQPYVLEMNPRFGGGYPFSHLAGADLPAALIAWAEGAVPNPDWFEVRPGIRSAKCDRLVIVDAMQGTSARRTTEYVSRERG